jgi:hypothetical protein
MYWCFVRLLNVKDTPYGGDLVSTTSGVAVVMVTMACKGVLWIVPMEKIKQIYVAEHRTVTTFGDMRREMDEYLLNKHKTTFSFGFTSFARIELTPLDWDVVSGGSERVTLRLPIVTAEESVQDVDVPLSKCSGMLIVRVEWKPSAHMMKAKTPAMPEGSLVLHVVGAAGFPGHYRQRWRCSFEVPEHLFGTTRQEVLLSLSEPVSFDGPREFCIQWIPPDSTMDNSCSTEANEQPDLMDDTSFRKRCLSMLQEQSLLMHEQSVKLDMQSRQLEEQSKKVERLEVQLQNQRFGS